MQRFASSLPVVVGIAALGLITLGCSKGSGLKTGSVSGTVTMNGQPVANAQVVFQPKQGGQNAVGTTDANGRYTLMTGTDRGAIIGEHRVTVTVQQGAEQLSGIDAADPSAAYGQAMMAAASGRPPAGQTQGSSGIPAKYADPNTSGLVFTVQAGSNTFNIELTP
ncbi:carboxypeptidase-like regulatory domain-containing protein [Thermopirellula anaerolimosa]